MNNVISTVIKFVTTGADKAAQGIQGVKSASDVATRSMATLATSLGSMSGTLGKAAGQVANFIFSVKQMGAVGGIVAGVQLAITQLSDYFIQKANDMLDAVERVGEKVRSRLDRVNQARMDGLKKELDEATTKAKEAAAAFDALASSYLKVQAAKDTTAASGASADASQLNLEKAEQMAKAGDDGKRALVGAAYDIQIARQNAKTVSDAQDRTVEAAKDEATVRERQAREARRTEQKTLKAMNRAAAIYEEDVNTGNDRNVANSKKEKEIAEKAHADAVNDRIRKEAEATEASERIIQAENERTAAINDAQRSIVDAEDAERRLIEAQKKTAEAELERLAAVRKATKVEENKADDGNRQILEQARGSFASKFESAFDLWRDPEAAAQAVEADKKRSSDMKLFNKTVNRYGGKGKIAEYAALMREGDEEGMQSRLEQWRKSARFTPQVEQMVKAEAARQNENASERALQDIVKNTANLDKKLDQLLSLK